MIKKSFTAFVCLIGLMTTLASCEDWGKMDPAAGIDIYPTRAKVATYSFEESTDLAELEYIKSVDGSACEIVLDDSLNSQVLHIKDGTVVHVFNPLTVITLQNGAGFTFWLRTPEGALPPSVVNAGGYALPLNGVPADGLWHFVGIQVKKDGFDVYSDGELVGNVAADNTALIEPVNTTEHVLLGASSGECWIDDISFIRNQMNEKDLQRPTIKRGDVKLPAAVYFNDFEKGAGDAEIVGAGSVRDESAEHFGKVFQNVGGALRSNYLKLPSHVLSHSAESQEMTIGFWVNAINAGDVATYTYAPFFTAYAAAPNPANGAPMMALQSRGPVQINNNGWSDFTGANHVDGKVNIYNQNAWEAGDGNYNFVRNWLEDNEWHFYAITFKATEVVQYLDGKVTNAWEFDGESEGQIITGLFNNGADLNYICLGGNQAWDWGDNDGGFAFDDFVIYDRALSSAQVNRIIEKKYGISGGDDEEDDTNKVYGELGVPECSDGFWSVFSPVVQLKDGQTAHYGFYNYTAGANNWENWVLICTNNGGASTGGDSEYFVLRADAWAWGQGFESPGNMTSDYNWDTFRTDMNGAWVDLTAERKGSTITVTAVTTTAEGATYNMKYVYEGASAEACGLYFTLEKAYLKFDPVQCWVGQSFKPGSKLVGAADCTAAWWTAFSDAYDFATGPEENCPFVFHFINNNTGAGSNWNNWLLVCTTGGGPGNPEHFVLRSDAYGWGNENYNADNIVHGFNWDTYVADMHGTECWVAVSHTGNTVKMNAVQKKADGGYLPPYSYHQDNISGKVGFFLTAELASLDLLHAAYYPYFSLIGATK